MNRFIFAALAAATMLPAASAHARPGESSFTPTSFVMPIYSIMLAHGLTTNVPLYSCTPSASDAGDAGAADCMVDMADATALANLFSEPAGIPAGTYDSIVVMTCASNSAFVAKVKGSVELEGQTYYTTSGVPTISTNPADLDYASINYGGCGNTIQISPPLTVAEGDSITVSAFFTLQNLSWVLGNFSPGLGGCASAPGGSFNVCSGLPVLVGYVGTQAPTLESYFVTEDPQDLAATKAAGQVMILSNDTGPFSGFLRRVYSHDSVDPSVSYDVPLRVITRNPDTEQTGDAGADAGAVVSDASPLDAGIVPTYDVRAIGDPFQDLTKYRVRFPRFELRDHNGTFFTANGASQVDYRAVKR